MSGSQIPKPHLVFRECLGNLHALIWCICCKIQLRKGQSTAGAFKLCLTPAGK